MTTVEAPPALGNLAKERLHRRLVELIAERPGRRVLDVGCVGPRPLELWRFLLSGSEDFNLTGIDVAGIERAVDVARREGWTNARFLRASGYDMAQRLGGERFDVVVSTQVLEHVRHLDRFVAQLAAVMAPGARALLTLDSGHFPRRVGPVRALAKWLLVRAAGKERYHELGWRDDQLEPAFAAHGLAVADRKFFNLHPLKWVHNHRVSPALQDELARRWYDLEILLNEDEAFVAANKRLFQGLYYELRAAD